MNMSPTKPCRKLTRTAERARSRVARGGGMRSRGVQNEAERGRLQQKNLETIKSHFLPLQPLEIPQNRQSFVWKSLDKNTLDLEKVGEKQGRFGMEKCRETATI